MNILELKDQFHKEGVNSEDWDKVSSRLRVLAYEFIDYCKTHQLPCVFTSIIRPKLPQSRTDIHARGRAFDCSVHGWSLEQILKCEKYFCELYIKIGAISDRDGISRACVYESPDYNGRGNGPHFHFQVRP